MKKMEKFYERYMKEKGITKWKPHYVVYHLPGIQAKRDIKYYNGFRAYKEHIKKGFETVPNDYLEFEKKMHFYYGWDFSTKCGDSVAAG